MSDEVRIVLSGASKEAHDRMLSAIRMDPRTSINSSKLISWIVLDFLDRSFEKKKNAICKAHYNSRKCVLEAMKNGDPEALKLALQEAAKSISVASPKEKKRTSKTNISEMSPAPEEK